MVLSRGQAVRWAGTGGNLKQDSAHIFVCVEVISPAPDDEYLIVPICTAHAKSDGTCPLGSADYKELKHASYAAFYQARLVSGKILRINAGAITPAKRVTPQVWGKIRQGVLKSDETPPRVLKALRALIAAEQAAKKAAAEALEPKPFAANTDLASQGDPTTKTA